MTLIKLEDAVKAVRSAPAGTDRRGAAIEQALRSLPTDDGVTDEMADVALRTWRQHLRFHTAADENGDPVFKSTAKEAMRAALEAALGATVSDGWEDIATAPRDGTEILLYTDTSKSGEETKSYVEAICEGEHVKRTQIGYWCFLQNNWEKPIIGDPLFWRPLPAPPTIE